MNSQREFIHSQQQEIHYSGWSPFELSAFLSCACFSFNNYLQFREQKTGGFAVVHTKLALYLSIEIKSAHSKQSDSLYNSQDDSVFFDILFCCQPSCDRVGGAAIKEPTFCHSWYSAYSKACMLWSPFKKKIAPPLCSCFLSSSPFTFHPLYTGIQSKFPFSPTHRVYSSQLCLHFKSVNQITGRSEVDYSSCSG